MRLHSKGEDGYPILCVSNFKLRKIRDEPPRKPISAQTKQNIAAALSILLLIVIIYWTSAQLLDALSGTRLIGFIANTFAKELKTDNKGHTNILLVGIGGEGHEGKDLTDTLIVASLTTTNEISLLSIPRDLYTETILGPTRINRLYEKAKLKWNSKEGLDFVRKTVQDILAIPVHYAIKVDFEAFEKTVDAVGGIDVVVEDTIDDSMYPKDGTYDFEPFFLEKGLQHLDGKTALKYVRSRKTTSDFDRSKRQQQALLAIKNKAKEKNIFEREGFLKDLYYSLTEHVDTDMSIRELLSLAKFASQWNSNALSMATLNDEPIFYGGFLYTPLRELYGGAYVLLPASDNWDSVRHFVQLVLYGPKNIQDFPLVILNGTKKIGLAATAKSILHRFGITVAAVGNARIQNLTATTWYAKDVSSEILLSYLKELIPGITSSQIPIEYSLEPKFADAKLIWELGEDSVPIIEELDIFKNVVSLVPANNTEHTNN